MKENSFLVCMVGKRKNPAPTPAAGYFYLNSNGAWGTNIDILNSAGMTSTTIGIGSNSNGVKNTAYVWTAIPGYSAFGGYTGNGSADGPFVYLGFKPALILTKPVSTGNWIIMDSARNGYNPADAPVYPNSTQQEVAPFYDVDFLSNGFKLRTNNTYNNPSGGVVVYAAFAENPFQSPVTAR